VKVDDIKQIAVVGAGFMGYQIGQDFAINGYEVNLYDTSKENLQQSLKNIQRDLHIFTELGLIKSEQIEPVLKRINLKDSLAEAVRDADVVIESVFEDLKLKQQLLKELDQLCPKHTILVSNSSGLPPSEMASATKRPDKFLLANHNNPTFLMPLLDVVRGKDTSDETVDTVYNLLTKMGKKPVIENEPGYVFNHLQRALLREALSIISKGIASPEEVDTVLKEGVGRRYSLVGMLEHYDSFGRWGYLAGMWSGWVSLIESSTEVPKALKDKVEDGSTFFEWSPGSVDEYNRKLVTSLAEYHKFYQKIET
jgi:3-hydroxybutyryl-CoA dehydrogenase